MKKLLLSIITIIWSILVLHAQTDTLAEYHDTIPGHYWKYYYSDWYDNKPWFFEHPNVYAYGFYLNHKHNYRIEHYTSGPLSISGLVALVMSPTRQDSILVVDYNYAPEYLKLFQGYGDTDDDLIFLDSVRWDTAHYHVMRLPFGSDSSIDGMVYCRAYECYFDKPIHVDSTFWISGTCNSWAPDATLSLHIGLGMRYTFFTSYLQPFYIYRCYVTDKNENILELLPQRIGFCTFLPITDNCKLTAVSEDVAQGSVQGGGYWPRSSHVTIEALPAEGYVFDHWDDGSTQNPRSIFLEHDTSFTAFFSPRMECAVTASSDPALGYVSGTGIYPYGTSVSLTAVPASPDCLFEQWNDGDWSNPRSLTVTQDTILTAIFSRHLDIDDNNTLGISIAPNPASTQVQVLSSFDIRRIKAVDMRGAAIYESSADSQIGAVTTLDISSWPSGHYIILVETSSGIAAKKLIKQ